MQVLTETISNALNDAYLQLCASDAVSDADEELLDGGDASSHSMSWWSPLAQRFTATCEAVLDAHATQEERRRRITKRQRESHGDQYTLEILDRIIDSVSVNRIASIPLSIASGDCMSSGRGMAVRKANPATSSSSSSLGIVGVIHEAQSEKRQQLYNCHNRNDPILMEGAVESSFQGGLPSPAAVLVTKLTIEAECLWKAQWMAVDTKLELLHALEPLHHMISSWQMRASANVMGRDSTQQQQQWVRFQSTRRGVVRAVFRNILSVDFVWDETPSNIQVQSPSKWQVCSSHVGLRSVDDGAQETSFLKCSGSAHEDGADDDAKQPTRTAQWNDEMEGMCLSWADVSTTTPVRLPDASERTWRAALQKILSERGLVDGFISCLRSACGLWMEVAHAQAVRIVGHQSALMSMLSSSKRLGCTVSIDAQPNSQFFLVQLKTVRADGVTEAVTSRFYVEHGTVLHQRIIGTNLASRSVRDAIGASAVSEDENAVVVDMERMLWADWNAHLAHLQEAFN